jgi:hypothetical protein
MHPANGLQDIPPAWGGETEPLDDASPLRQGDVFRWESQQPPWELHGILVTADCDIARRKHGGILSYVPVLALADYWRLFTLPARIETQVLEKTHALLRNVITKLQSVNRSDSEPMSSEALDDLVRDRAITEILDTLNVPAAQREYPSRLTIAYRAAIAPRSEIASLQDLAGVLAELREVAKPKPGRADSSNVLDELAGAVRQLPGDAFFIGQIVPAAEEAYVAYLRAVRELPVSALALKPIELRRGAKARRVARLKSPFIYRLTQQLGAVFADVGLPTEYESDRTVRALAARAALGTTEQDK